MEWFSSPTVPRTTGLPVGAALHAVELDILRSAGPVLLFNIVCPHGGSNEVRNAESNTDEWDHFEDTSHGSKSNVIGLLGLDDGRFLFAVVAFEGEVAGVVGGSGILALEEEEEDCAHDWDGIDWVVDEGVGD